MKRHLLSVVGLAAALTVSASTAFAAQDLLFSLQTSGLTGNAGDAITTLAIGSGSSMTGNFAAVTNSATKCPAPKVEVVGGVKWSKNTMDTALAPATIYGTGYAVAAGPGNISIANGFSIVTAIRPEDILASGGNLRSMVNIYGNQLQLAMMDTGELKVRRVTATSGTTSLTVTSDTQTGPKLTANVATVISMVVNADGSFKVWSTASGANPVMTVGALTAWSGGTITSLIKGPSGGTAGIGYASGVSPGGSSWRGLIGNTYVYKSVLTEDERLQVVSNVQSSMGLATVPEPASIITLLMGLGSVAGLARRKR